MKPTLLFWVLLSVSVIAFGQDEYFVHHGTEARALSKELQANAHVSPKRFDGTQDVSTLQAWLIGSCRTAADDFHLIAYFSTPQVAYVGVFRRDEQLDTLWRFSYDARQFYVEGTKLMFTARPMMHEDTAETWARVPREVVIDFGALPADRTFTFHDVKYGLTR
jgi:hypothetical protein